MSTNSLFYLIMFDLGSGEASLRVGSQPLEEVTNRDLVEVDVKLLLQLIQVLLLRLG